VAASGSPPPSQRSSRGRDGAARQARFSRATTSRRPRYEAVFTHTVIGLHEDRLDGTRKSAPNGFYGGVHGVVNGTILTKFLVTTCLGWTPDEVVRLQAKKHFGRFLLGPMLQAVFGDAPWRAVEAAYPGRFLPWEFPHAPASYWRGRDGRAHALEATRWLFETKLGWSKDDVRARTCRKTFLDHGLAGMLHIVYGGSPWRTVDALYPGLVLPWEMTPMGYWSGRDGRAHAVEAIRWLFETRLRWSDEQIRDEPRLHQMFATSGLAGLLVCRYGGSPRRALAEAYPGRFAPWDSRVDAGYWKGPRGRARGVEAVRWLVEKRLQWSDDQVKAFLTPDTFKAHHLSGMLGSVFGGSVSRALREAYPGRFDPDDLPDRRRRRPFVVRSVVEVLAILEEGDRRGLRKSCERHGASYRRYRALQDVYERDGVRGLVARLDGAHGGRRPDVRAAIIDAAYAEPMATPAAASRSLRARGVRASPATVRAVWTSLDLLAAKQRLRQLERARRYPTLNVAAKTLGMPPRTLYKWQRRFEAEGLAGLQRRSNHSRELEAAILSLALEHPEQTPFGLAADLARQGLRVSWMGVARVLDRHLLGSTTARVAACKRPLPWIRKLRATTAA